MKHLALLLLVTGCSKEPGMMIGMGPTFLQTRTVAFAGQSNIVAGNGLSDQVTGNKIECAVGGTYIAEWQKGQRLYESCLAQMKQSPPAAIIWWQGEADAHDMGLTLIWKDQFERMVKDMRTDLGASVLFIYVQLGNGPSGEMATPVWQEMRRQQASVQLPDMVMVDVTFAHQFHKINNDGNIDVHYTRDGYIAIGKRLEIQYLNLQ